MYSNLDYTLAVHEPFIDLYGNRKHEYRITLGEELKKLKPVLQKRWVRQRVEKEWGAPVKNFTQKRMWYDTFFEKTEYITDADFWQLIICQPETNPAGHTWL